MLAFALSNEGSSRRQYWAACIRHLAQTPAVCDARAAWPPKRAENAGSIDAID
jgi:hypothetical protein